MDTPLQFTGERFIPDDDRITQIHFEHLHRYAIALELVAGRSVADVASGEGYGSALLASKASTVIGFDNAADAVAHARRKYGHPRLRFEVADCTRLPLDDQSIEVVVSFETIEHIESPQGFLQECRRILKPDGMLIISSPDRLVYGASGRPRNMFHVHELTHHEFAGLLRENFPHVAIGRQRLVAGSYFAFDTDAHATPGSFISDPDDPRFEPGVIKGVYSLAVCSNQPIRSLPVGVFEDPGTSAYIWDWWEQGYNIRAALLEIENTSAARANVIQDLKEQLETAPQKIQDLEQARRDAHDALTDQRRTISHISGQLAQSEAELREARQQLDKRPSLEAFADQRKELCDMQLEAQKLRNALAASMARSEQQTLLLEERTAWARDLEKEREHMRKQAQHFLNLSEARSQLASQRLEMLKSLENKLAESNAQEKLLAERIRADKAELRERFDTATARYRAQTDQLEQQIAAAQAQLYQCLEAGKHSVEECLALEAQIKAMTDQLQRQSDKIQRMTASLSWRVTGPLRAVRRMLLDPWTR